MHTIEVYDLLSRERLNNASVEVRGPAEVHNFGGQFQIEGLPEAWLRVSAPDHVPQYRGLGGGNIGEAVFLRPTSTLPHPLHGGTRLTWDELRTGWLPDWDQLAVSSAPGIPGFVEFKIMTQQGIWWKAVKIFDSTGELRQDLQSEEGHPAFGPADVFETSALRGSLLVLAKAKFLGFHTDMYEVALDDQVLSQLNGFVWTFNWIMQ